MDSQKTVYLICLGGHAKQVIDVFLENNYNILGAYDDNKKGTNYRGIKILGSLSEIQNLETDQPFFCTIGDNKLRQEICNPLQNINWINCISRHAYISPSVKIGYGNYIGVHARILSDSVIGNHNIINDGSTLTHDNYIGDFNHIAPSASLGGRVKIGNSNLIGTNSTINPNVKISNK